MVEIEAPGVAESPPAKVDKAEIGKVAVRTLKVGKAEIPKVVVGMAKSGVTVTVGTIKVGKASLVGILMEVGEGT